jgi:FixJ family two-component response regulator
MTNGFNFHPESLSWNRKGILTATYAMTLKLISVIDDDASVRKTTKLLIESFGYRAVVFESADTFLKSGQLNDTSCLVLDVQMPGMNGLQLQRHLASEGCSIPIIFISAYENEESRRQAMEASAVAFLDKPFDDKQLLKCIRSALEISES